MAWAYHVASETPLTISEELWLIETRLESLTSLVNSFVERVNNG